MNIEQAWKALNDAEELCSAHDVQNCISRLATEISAVVANEFPMVLSVMGGAVVFTGQLLPMLRFPLEFDYIHVTRYAGKTSGSEIKWIVDPKQNLRGRAVLVIDDVLDEGHTMAAIREKILASGAKSLYSAVLVDKDLGKPKPLAADFVGMKLPNRYLFGLGMDIEGMWRNLPSIYAVR
jgi:hypoxanthine phosphoribosyltransferase